MMKRIGVFALMLSTVGAVFTPATAFAQGRYDHGDYRDCDRHERRDRREYRYWDRREHREHRRAWR